MLHLKVLFSSTHVSRKRNVKLGELVSPSHESQLRAPPTKRRKLNGTTTIATSTDSDGEEHRFILSVIFEFFGDKISRFEIDSIGILWQTITCCISLKPQKKAFSILNINFQFRQNVEK